MAVNVGDKVTTKKPHPCGSAEWTIIRTGADVKLKCTKCGRVIMLTLNDFKKRLKNS